MKKRTIKSLELNKKTISTLDRAEVKGGSTLPTSAYVYSPLIPYAVQAAIDELTDYIE
ncbi:hypothetical protein C8N46_10275 [Kordia periserrulae]|uniref:Uncharacterized protein n=1 Tax=Kordia periserrulae TaxID=701523 RepID=A0A2T6C2X7_9FLAO|nr:hypothetical protein [Kordia periserrulae]PTX62679.1 hypothetical protein C8N46_10275 [Kordia periserrulae]